MGGNLGTRPWRTHRDEGARHVWRRAEVSKPVAQKGCCVRACGDGVCVVGSDEWSMRRRQRTETVARPVGVVLEAQGFPVRVPQRASGHVSRWGPHEAILERCDDGSNRSSTFFFWPPPSHTNHILTNPNLTHSQHRPNFLVILEKQRRLCYCFTATARTKPSKQRRRPQPQATDASQKEGRWSTARKAGSRSCACHHPRRTTSARGATIADPGHHRQADESPWWVRYSLPPFTPRGRRCPPHVFQRCCCRGRKRCSSRPPLPFHTRQQRQRPSLALHPHHSAQRRVHACRRAPTAHLLTPYPPATVLDECERGGALGVGGAEEAEDDGGSSTTTRSRGRA